MRTAIDNWHGDIDEADADVLLNASYELHLDARRRGQTNAFPEWYVLRDMSSDDDRNYLDRAADQDAPNEGGNFNGGCARHRRWREPGY